MKSYLLATIAAIFIAGCGNSDRSTDIAANDNAINDQEFEDSASSETSDEIQTGAASTGETSGDPIGAAILDPARTDEARARDAGRKPDQVLKLAQIAPGQTIVDIASSSDYYAPILSNIAGPDGQLIMIEPKRLEAFFPQALDSASAYANGDDTDNIISIRTNLDEMSFAAPVDRVLNILYYHDTVWSGVDRAVMNKSIYDALKPGGFYLIIDHAAKAGSDESVTNDLHRIDPALVMAEVRAAGFVLAQESELLANPDDPMEEGVFGALRGKTNRFSLLFRKPE